MLLYNCQNVNASRTNGENDIIVYYVKNITFIYCIYNYFTSYTFKYSFYTLYINEYTNTYMLTSIYVNRYIA